MVLGNFGLGGVSAAMVKTGNYGHVCMVIFYIHMIYYFVHLVGTGMYCRYREKGHQCLGADFLAAGFFSVPKDQLIN